MTNNSGGQSTKAGVEAVFDDADDEVKRVVGEVLRIERDNLHMSRPRVLDDVVAVIRRIIE